MANLQARGIASLSPAPCMLGGMQVRPLPVAARSPAPSRPYEATGVRCRAPAAAAPQAVAESPAAEFTPSISGCPVLSGLKPLPDSKDKWWEQTLAMFSTPKQYQHSILQGRPYATGTFAFAPGLMLGDVEVAKEVVATEGENIESGWLPSTVELLGPNALAPVRDVKRHRSLRQMISPAVRGEEVDAALPAIQAMAQQLLDGWADEGEAGKVVVSFQGFRHFTFSVITHMCFGAALPKQESARLEALYAKWLENLFVMPALTVNKWPFPYRESMLARVSIVEFITRKVLEARIQIAGAGIAAAGSTTTSSSSSSSSSAVPSGTSPASSSSGNGRSSSAVASTDGSSSIIGSQAGTVGAASAYGAPRTTALQRLLTEPDEDGNTLTDDEVADNVLTLLFAGHDTSASALTCALHQLAMNPHIMQALRQEQEAVVAALGDAITPEALKRMRYTEAMVKEVLRTTPIVAQTMRVAKKDFELQGHLVPQGLQIMLGLHTMLLKDPRWLHRTDELSPERFNPDRFLTEEGAKQGHQVPFGFGSRVCIGLNLAMSEMKVFLAVLARGYDFKADWNCSYIHFPMPRPSNDLPIMMYRRQ